MKVKLRNLLSFLRSMSKNIRETIRERIRMKNIYYVVCRDHYGNLKWADVIYNTVCDVGINDLLDKYLKGANYNAAHYMMLLSATPVVAEGDTMADHAGWTEVIAYDEATRPVLTWGTVAAKSVDNSEAPVRYTINVNETGMGGIAIVTNATKGGTTGIIYGGGAFTKGNKMLSAGDTLDVTATATGASA